jgi:hypothetical protein
MQPRRASRAEANSFGTPARQAASVSREDDRRQADRARSPAHAPDAPRATDALDSSIQIDGGAHRHAKSQRGRLLDIRPTERAHRRMRPTRHAPRATDAPDGRRLPMRDLRLNFRSHLTGTMARLA